MGLSDQLKAGVGPLWEEVVSHPFVLQLGDDSLSPDVFHRYFEQDYLFLKDWVVLLSLAAAKAPDFDAARRVVGFLHLGLGGEERLFRRAFSERGLSPRQVDALEHRPSTLHYSGYLRRTAYEGSFLDLVTTLLAVEWPYLDWAQRLTAAGKQPENYYYRAWIDIHASPQMVDFVDWLKQTVDSAGMSAAGQAHLQNIFRDVLRYELMFWSTAWQDERWPQ
jgi:thiaminase/transcriptional activator TenA